jgi:hypothetical protein
MVSETSFQISAFFSVIFFSSLTILSEIEDALRTQVGQAQVARKKRNVREHEISAIMFSSIDTISDRFWTRKGGWGHLV